jgi:hypothetical protein
MPSSLDATEQDESAGTYRIQQDCRDDSLLLHFPTNP